MAGLGISRTKKRSDYGLVGQGTVRRGAFAKSSYQTGNTYFRLAKVGQDVNQGFNAFQQGRTGAMFRAPETGLRGILSRSFTAFRPGATVKGKAGFFRELAYRAGGRRIAASQRPGVGTAIAKTALALAPSLRGKGALGRVGRFARQVQGFQRQGGAMGYVKRRLSGKADTTFQKRESALGARQARDTAQREQARQQAQQQRQQAQQQAQQQRQAAQQQAQQQRQQAQQQRDADKAQRQQAQQRAQEQRELQKEGREAIKKAGGVSVSTAYRRATQPEKAPKTSKTPKTQKQQPTTISEPMQRPVRKSQAGVKKKRIQREVEARTPLSTRGAIGGVKRGRLAAELSTVRKGFKTDTYTIDDVRKARENIKQGKSAIGVLKKDQPPIGAAPRTVKEAPKGKVGEREKKLNRERIAAQMQTPQQSPADNIVKGRDKQTKDAIKKAEAQQQAQQQVTLPTGEKVARFTAKNFKEVPYIPKKETGKKREAKGPLTKEQKSDLNWEYYKKKNPNAKRRKRAGKLLNPKVK